MGIFDFLKSKKDKSKKDKNEYEIDPTAKLIIDQIKKYEKGEKVPRSFSVGLNYEIIEKHEKESEDELTEEEKEWEDEIKSEKKKRSPKKIGKKKKSSKPLESEKMRKIRNLRKMILENKDDPNRLVFMEEQIIEMLEAIKTLGFDIEENSDVIAGFEELLDLVKKYK